jgi:hypothetical protein
VPGDLLVVVVPADLRLESSGESEASVGRGTAPLVPRRGQIELDADQRFGQIACRKSASTRATRKTRERVGAGLWDRPHGLPRRDESGSRREAVRDRGRLEPVGRVELAEDVGDVDAGRLDADDERLRDLTVGVAARDEPQHLRLARREAEDLLQVLPAVRRSRVGRREIEPRTIGANAVVGAVATVAVGKAAGANGLLRELGGVFGVALAVTVFAGAGGYASPEAFTEGFAAAIGVAAAME